MKKLFFFASMLMLGTVTAQAVDFLVQTGEDADPKWTESVVSETGATLIDLKTAGQSVDVALAAHVAEAYNKEIWFAGGQYTFGASYKNIGGTQFIGGFAGTETAVDQRQLKADGAAWEFANATVFDGKDEVWLLSGNQPLTLDGVTLQNSRNAANIGTVRAGNNSAIRNCMFVGNASTVNNGQGGAVMVYNANVTIENCYFEGNEGGQGGAIYANNATQELVVRGCYFKDNFVHAASTAGNSGGAIHVQNGGRVLIDACYFEGNKVENAKNGAAVSFATTNAESTIQNCVFYANDCEKNAVYMANGKFYYNTVVENAGGALYATTADIKNSVFWGTERAKAALAVNAATVQIDYSAALVELSGNTVVGEHMLVLDMTNTGEAEGVLYPKFTNVAEADFTLTKGSALAEAGVAIEGITTDIAGEERKNADIGAYAYVAGSSTGVEKAEAETLDIEAALRAGEVFDMMGRRVGEVLQSGLYVVGGRTVLLTK